MPGRAPGIAAVAILAGPGRASRAVTVAVRTPVSTTGVVSAIGVVCSVRTIGGGRGHRDSFHERRRSWRPTRLIALCFACETLPAGTTCQGAVR